MLGLWFVLLQEAAAADAPVSTIQKCATPATRLPDGLKAAKKAVVRVDTTLGSGSGVFVTGDGFVLTAAHVVGTAKTVSVVLEDGSALDGSVVRRSDRDDVALVRVAVPKSPCIPVATKRAETGTDLYVIGSPGGNGLDQTVTRGIVSAYRESDGRYFLQTDASINPGNSGGPMIGLDGSIAAVVDFKAVGAGIEGLGFGMAAESIPVALGVTFGDKTDAEFATRLDLGVESAPTPVSVPPPSVTNRPAKVKLFAVKDKWCEKWVSSAPDPFSGEAKVSAPQPYGSSAGYLIEQTKDGLSIVLPAYLSDAAIDVNTAQVGPPMELSLALMDGTRIVMFDNGLRALGTNLGGTPAIMYHFSITPEVVDALGSSLIDIVRYKFSADHIQDLKVGGASGFAEDLQSSSACVAKVMRR